MLPLVAAKTVDNEAIELASPSSALGSPAGPASSAVVASAVPQPSDCMLTWSELSAYSSHGRTLLQQQSGYVRRGGITAVLGEGGSGKSLLLRLLCGREPALTVRGSVVCNGQALVTGRASRLLGFVGQEDVGLIGELTARETIAFNARLGSASRSSDDEVRAIVDEVIAGLGLQDVADNAIGTVLKRGLSGGEKRRVSVGAVLGSRPDVICLDEPTSGLDAAVAYTAIQSIKSLAARLGIGVLMTIHQPSARILTLLDDLIILDSGRTVYGGPMALAPPHFAALGFPCPASTTATDHFLDVIRHAQGAPDRFFQAYGNSALRSVIQQRVEQPTAGPPAVLPSRAPFGRQMQTLLQRNAQVAMRDLTLYYLQMNMAIGFSFMTGVVFWQLPRIIGPRLQDTGNGIVWLVYIGAYLQIFKVYHLFTSKNRVQDETANNLYSTTAWTAANFLTSAVCIFCVYVPSLLIGYGMMGLPNAAIGYTLFSLWMTVMTAEAMVELLLQFTSHLPTAILLGQGAMVILSVYAGGAFIRWSSLGFWVWLSELSLFTWSTRGIMIVVYRNMNFYCPSDLITASNTCSYSGVVYPCQGGLASDGSCTVSGPTVLQDYQLVSASDEWLQFGILVLLFGCFRLLVWGCLAFPPHVLYHRMRGLLLQLAGANSVVAIPSSPHSPAVPGTETVVQLREQPSSSAAAAEQAKSNAGPMLKFRDVSLRLDSKAGTLLLDRISGSARAGRVLAIMGPSGSSKTTLLNAICGRAPYAKFSGSVTLDEQPLSNRHIAYVPQTDSLNRAFTIQQTFSLTAQLQRADGSDKAAGIEELLDILSLTEQRHELVGKLSSGERKRIAIGVGLLSAPRVLLLDEPTTGLDSATSAVIVDYILRVTRRTGVICLLTIHQPSAQLFASLDDLLLLSKGKMAFFGPLQAVRGYFASLGFEPPAGSNPADFYLDLMNARPDELSAFHNGDKALADPAAAGFSWQETLARRQDEITPKDASGAQQQQPHGALATVHPSEARRLPVLIASRLLYFWQERALYLYRLIVLILIAVFAGTLFLRLSASVSNVQELGGALFFKVWVILFVAISGTPILIHDRLVFENEYLNQTYSAGSFCLATFIASLPSQLLSAIVFEAIMWYLVGFNDAFEAYVFSVASTFSLLLMMESISLMTVQVLKDAMLATTFSMVVLGMLFLFPGFFVSTDNMVQSIRWMSYVVPTHYDLDSQLYNVFSGQSYLQADGSSQSGDSVLSQFFSVNLTYNKWIDWFIVMVYMAGFRMMHWMLLLFQYRKYGHAH